METVLFAALGLIAILGALLTITAPAPIASALYLVSTLFGLAGLYVLLAAPFVAAIQIIVYAGAVIVLILFVIMLLNLKPIEERVPAVWKAAGIVTASLILLVTFLSIMSVSSWAASPELMPRSFGTVGEIGRIIFSKYLYAFEVVSVLLLLAVIGAVALIRKQDSGEADAH
jgi:NADH-quinone oxidoreductase subunit J